MKTADILRIMYDDKYSFGMRSEPGKAIIAIIERFEEECDQHNAPELCSCERCNLLGNLTRSLKGV